MAGPVARAADDGKPAPIAAEAFLRALADHGVDYFFVNPGTDFPPIVEALSRAPKTTPRCRSPILVPHENLAVAMAHGAYLMTGRAAGGDGARQCRHRQHASTTSPISRATACR